MSRFSQMLFGFPAFKRFDRWLGKTFTTSGKLLLCASVVFLVGSCHLDTPVYILSGAASSLLIVSLVANRFLRPTLRVRVSVPRYVSIDEPFPLWAEIKNTGKRDALDLELQLINSPAMSNVLVADEESVFMERLEPMRSSMVSMALRASRRGSFEIPALEIATTYPVNLCRASTVYPFSGELLVVPQRKRIPAIDKVFESASLRAGENAAMSSLGVDQFAGSREYVPGIPVKRWDHQAWARLGTPHVYQYENETQSQISIVLSLAKCSDSIICEAAVTFVWSLASALCEQGQLINSLTIGQRKIPLQGDARRQSDEIGMALARVDFANDIDCSAPVLDPTTEAEAIVVTPLHSSDAYEPPEYPHGVRAIEVFVVPNASEASGIQVTVEEIENGEVWR